MTFPLNGNYMARNVNSGDWTFCVASSRDGQAIDYGRVDESNPEDWEMWLVRPTAGNKFIPVKRVPVPMTFT